MRATFLLTIGAAFILSCGAREQTVTAASTATPPHTAPAAATAQQVAELTKRIDDLTKRVETAEKAAQDANARASAPAPLPNMLIVEAIRAKRFVVMNDAEEVVASLAETKHGEGANLILNSPRGGYTVALEALPNTGGLSVHESGGRRAWEFPRR